METARGVKTAVSLKSDAEAIHEFGKRVSKLAINRFYSNPMGDPEIWKAIGDMLTGPAKWAAGEAAAWEGARRSAEMALKAVPGVTRAMVTLTAERATEPSASLAPKPSAAVAAGQAGFPSLAKVRHIVAVASGKGGVGKSTTTVNLALALRAQGFAVGVLDADIYGPSMPKLFALRGRPRIVSGRTLAPMEAYGCKVMSIGFVVDADKAMVWRGPMVASAITQMLRDVAWGELDVLLVDMPPGTGDAQLTMAQQTPLSGAVIVSTPQDLALIDARRGVAMFQDVGVPILGIVENMSYFVCDECGKRHFIFAHGGARAEAQRLGVPFLGEVPLDLEIRERSDAGLPVVVTDPDSASAAIYRELAAAVAQGLNQLKS
jgi:ATP-binding protein involved in chromosome partitioning